MADWWNTAGGATGGALSGAASGAAIGSAVPGIGTAIGAGLGGLAGAVGGGLANRASNSETKTQAKQRELVDDLLASLKGNGSYNDLFKGDEATFQKSFVDPAKARFQNQIAPQIKENYAQYGQSNGTGINDELLRAGVDMDSMLNQHYANFQQGAQNRQAGAMNAILGQGAGAANQQSLLNTGLQAGAGYINSSAGQKNIQDILDAYNRPKGVNNSGQPLTNGFTG